MALTHFLKRDDTIKRELPRVMATPGELPMLSRPIPPADSRARSPPSAASSAPLELCILPTCCVLTSWGFFSPILTKNQNSDHTPPITVSFLLYPLQLNSTEAKSLTIKPLSSSLPRLLTLIQSGYPPQQSTTPALVQTRLPPSSILGSHIPAVASDTTVHSKLL